MKLIRSQDKLMVINAAQIFHIDIEDAVDEDGDDTGEVDIDVHFDSLEDSWMQTIATYPTTDEAIRNLDRLVDFLGSSTAFGVYQMP
ncbi:MAG: hypothetical protein FWC89_10760 [Defluviitaleaceae bacterium]|nr:hypothetical protein [Defluviitaleaceae bacterium]